MFNISVDSTKSDAISELDRRLKNPFWSGFALAWITWNWRVWYLTFFVSESLIGNKIAEIQRMYEYFGWNALPGFFLNWIIIPVCISGIITFWLPKLTDKFLQKQKKNKENEDIILRANIKEETETTKSNTKLLKAQKEEIEALKEKQKAEIEAEIEKRTQERLLEFNKTSKKSEQELWNEEYIKLLAEHKGILNELKVFIYTNKGYRSNYGNINALSIFDIYKLVEKLPGLYNGNETYQLTEKGRYFLKN